MPAKDITSQEDVKRLIDSFYTKVVADPVIGFIFNEVIKLSWDKHIPVMYAFWGSLLLGTHGYQGNPMIKHVDLDKKIALKQEHFDRWLELWGQTINENFSGEKANEAISRAKNIAALMFHKIEQSR